MSIDLLPLPERAPGLETFCFGYDGGAVKGAGQMVFAVACSGYPTQRPVA
jgi:hypothetical protein